jgi:hypothetical protein
MYRFLALFRRNPEREMKMTYLIERLLAVQREFPEVPLEALKAAMIEGIEAFAWFRDGVQYVGTTGTRRRDAVNEILEFRAQENFHV